MGNVQVMAVGVLGMDLQTVAMLCLAWMCCWRLKAKPFSALCCAVLPTMQHRLPEGRANPNLRVVISCITLKCTASTMCVHSATLTLQLPCYRPLQPFRHHSSSRSGAAPWIRSGAAQARVIRVAAQGSDGGGGGSSSGGGGGGVKPAAPRGEQLQELDRLLAADGAAAEAAATSLIAELSRSGALRGFGAAAQVPKRTYSLAELRLNRIQPEQFLSPKDATLDGVRSVAQGAFLAGCTAWYFVGGADLGQVAIVVLGAAFLLTLDQVGAGGGVEALLIDQGELCRQVMPFASLP